LADCQAAFSPVAGERVGRDGGTARAHVVSPGTGRSRGHPASRDASGAQGAARSAGGAALVGVSRPGSEPPPGRVR
jgi:hypothetical protein